jgi:phosphoribosylformylglycinamidine synthase
MSIQSDMRLFRAPLELVPKHVQERNRINAQKVLGDIWNYSESVLYAVTWELQNDEKARRVLRTTEAELNPDILSAFIGQRPGTITPWSSKVWNILLDTGVTWEGRVEKIIYHSFDSDAEWAHAKVWNIWHDKMMQISVETHPEIQKMFDLWEKEIQKHIDLQGWWKSALESWNKGIWWALSEQQMDYLCVLFWRYGRNPTDTELFAFAQGNSEHCDHGTFNGLHTIDGIEQETSFFSRIKNTRKHSPEKVLSAYKDNASAIQWSKGEIMMVWRDGTYQLTEVDLAHTLKVETHNHPTRISPYPGAATWTGWEIRDDGAVWRWSHPNTWTVWFSVSNLNQTDISPGWASPSEIMIEWPLWASAFGNEFWRPTLNGYFRMFEQVVGGTHWGFNKPIMLAGGKWNIIESNVVKKLLPPWTLIIQLWGPWMNIWLGWGSGSSTNAGSQSEELDFASVQRPNPEMQRRCQQIIDGCATMQEENPILSIHDVGAGGIGNAVQEFVHDAWMWAIIDFTKIPVADPTMSPMETWSNESQERYVIGINPDSFELFNDLCWRENACYAVIGEIREGRQFILENEDTNEVSIDVNLDDFLGHGVELKLTDNTVTIDGWEVNLEAMKLDETISKVLSHPSVWDKTFLVTINDRTVKWRTTQDQMVGDWQIPLSNVWVTLHWMEWIIWEVITQWERSPLGVVNPEASVRMALGESFTNLMASSIEDTRSIQISWNWMAAKSHPGQLAALAYWVAAAEKMCIDLSTVIPVWKDSLSMKASSPAGDVVSPLSFNSTIEAETQDVYKTLTPELQRVDNSELFLIDLWEGKNRIGWSILAQVHGEFGNEVPDVDNPELLWKFIRAMQELHQAWILLAYHDRSDWGVFTTLSEMAFAAHAWLDIDISNISNQDHESYMKALFSEELWAVVQVDSSNKGLFKEILERNWVWSITHKIWSPNFDKQDINIWYAWRYNLVADTRVNLQQQWSESNLERRRLQWNPETAQQEFDRIWVEDEPMMRNEVTFDVSEHSVHKTIADYESNNKPKPRVAILRTQGTNGQEEMARYYMRCWFEAVDVHMDDLKTWRHKLEDFTWVAIPGWFSFWDALWAGAWFARTIEECESIANQFKVFKGFIFGVCNGCQVISQLKDILPDGHTFPDFKRNDSTLFEARKSSVSILENRDSKFLKGMGGSMIPVISSNGEGKSEWWNLIPSMRFVDHYGNATDKYPHNPNGSKAWATWYEVGNVLFMMSHPEREPNPESPWLQIPLNLRQWVEEQKAAWILKY